LRRFIDRYFFNRRRTIAIVIGLFSGCLFYTIASNMKVGIFQDLIVNLAATAFAIPFVTSIVEYEIERSELKRAEKIRNLMSTSLSNIVDTAFLALAMFYAFQPRQRKSFVEGADWLDSIDEHARSFLGEINFETAGVTEKRVSRYAEALNEQIHELDEVLRLFGFAMPVELQGAALDLRNKLVRVNGFWIGSGDELVEVSMRTGAPWIHQALKELDFQLSRWKRNDK